MLVLASMLVWIVWGGFAIAFSDLINTNADDRSTFFLILVWSFIVYLALLYPIISPDMNLVSKKVNDANRKEVLSLRRYLFSSIQFLFVFLAGGTSISLFYETWRIGVGVTVGIYGVGMIILMACYGWRFKKLTRGVASEGGTFDEGEETAEVVKEGKTLDADGEVEEK